MAIVAWLVHRGLVAIDLDRPAILRAAMIISGAIAFVGAALVIARDSAGSGS